MLEFFRRYQRAFFIVITVVIVISFSFFGTYQTFSGNQQEDKVAFTALDGSKVRHSDVQDMISFLSSDSNDYLSSASAAGNALNDGVVATDILESGLATVIAQPFLTEIGHELQSRFEREKRYKPYSHPKASFLTAEQIWAYYAPDIKTNFERLRLLTQAGDKEAFAARVNLFVAERRFPAPYLRQLLHYQAANYKWLPQDPNLAYQDLSLFNYHSTQDWFGRQFVELCADFIINSAKVAEQKGYKVTKEEVLGSLFRNAEDAFREARSQGMLTATNVGDFFQEQLRRLGMDQSRLVKVWTQVLLFRTLFFENADSILVDASGYKDFYHHLNEYVDIDLYQLPKELQFQKLRDLEEFALYLAAVRVPIEGSKTQNPLSLPLSSASPSIVKKVYPELVERSFTLGTQSYNKELLQTKIGVKDTWEWQVQDTNWERLMTRFNDIADKEEFGAEDRLKILDALDPAKRAHVDTFSRQQIIDQHPEWVKSALSDAPLKEEEITIREKGGKIPFVGFTNTPSLIALLDNAPLNEVSPELSELTQDGVHYLRIQVLDRSKPERVLPFAEAKNDGTIGNILDKTLEANYSRARNKDPSRFMKENGEWKPFKEVKDDIALFYFEDLFRLLDHEIEVFKGKMPEFTDWSIREQALLAVSLLPYVQEEQIAARDRRELGEEQNKLNESDFVDQFALVQSRVRLVRRDPSFAAHPDLAFSLEMNSMTPVHTYQNNGPSFFVVMGKGFLSQEAEVRNKVLEERALLGREAMCELAGNMLTLMQKKGALNIELKESQTRRSGEQIAKSESGDEQ